MTPSNKARSSLVNPTKAQNQNSSPAKAKRPAVTVTASSTATTDSITVITPPLDVAKTTTISEHSEHSTNAITSESYSQNKISPAFDPDLPYFSQDTLSALLALNHTMLPQIDSHGKGYPDSQDIDLDNLNLIANTDSKGVGFKVLPINYALSLLAQLQPIPLHVFDGDGHYLKKLDNDSEDNWNVLKTDKEYRQQLIETIKAQRLTLFTNERPVLLGGIALADKLILIIGPVVMSKVHPNFAQLFATKHKATNVVLQECPPTKLASMLLLINAALTGEKIPLTAFLDRFFIHEDLIKDTLNKAADIFYHETVLSRPHNPISFEHNIIDAVKQGNCEGLERALNSPFASMRGTLATDSLRSHKNLAIVDITLASRALIDTGFSAEEGFIMSDAFIRNVEEAKSSEEASAIARACAMRCAQLVKKQKEDAKRQQISKSPLVQQACDYLDRYVFTKFDVQVLAKQLHVSAGYLSKLFLKEQHITMSDYMRKRKIEIAMMMLTNTEQSLGEIALSLSFCSQSHFGRIFLKEVGCTPSAYRKRIKLQSGKLQTAYISTSNDDSNDDTHDGSDNDSDVSSNSQNN